MNLSLKQRITGGALLIAAFSILFSGLLFYYATSRIITDMAVGELNHMVETSAGMIDQASRHAIVSLLRARVEGSKELVANYYMQYQAG